MDRKRINSRVLAQVSLRLPHNPISISDLSPISHPNRSSTRPPPFLTQSGPPFRICPHGPLPMVSPPPTTGSVKNWVAKSVGLHEPYSTNMQDPVAYRYPPQSLESVWHATQQSRASVILATVLYDGISSG